jgi:shikimate dehydrogenase
MRPRRAGIVLCNALALRGWGAARAVLFGLLDRGIRRILLVNRTAERAAALRAQFGDRVEAARWGDLDGLMAEAGLLVNTTSLGMSGQPPLSIQLARLPANAVVSDLVYAPLETALLAAARSRGLRAVDGLGMLLHQAVGGFQRWFGMRPQVTEALRALVEADLISK